MKLSLSRILATTALAAVALGAAAPAFAETQFQSNHNIWQVRSRVERDIRMLQHDDRDYGGHRVSAVNDLQAARSELLAAEQAEHGRPVTGDAPQPDSLPGDRSQGASNRSIWRIHRNVERLIAQLERDKSDYSGHRAAAMNDLRNARGELIAAEQFAKAHGY